MYMFVFSYVRTCIVIFHMHIMNRGCSEVNTVQISRFNEVYRTLKSVKWNIAFQLNIYLEPLT